MIGVVLSGHLDEGAAGLAAVKRRGGTAVVQDPKDAAAPDMPQAALRAIDVDHCAPAARLGSLVAEIARTAPRPEVPAPADLAIEVDIAAGGPIGTARLKEIADFAPMTCPSCQGTLSEMRNGRKLRFRCQVGHAFSAEALLAEQRDNVDHALRVALRVLEEQAYLVGRMAADASETGRTAVVRMYEERAAEYGDQSETIRRALVMSLQSEDAGD